MEELNKRFDYLNPKAEALRDAEEKLRRERLMSGGKKVFRHTDQIWDILKLVLEHSLSVLAETTKKFTAQILHLKE